MARPRLRTEAGMTIPEVVTAALLLALGALAVLALVDTASRSTYRAEQGQVVVDRLQAELEHMRQLPFAEVALTEQPGSSPDPSVPANRVAESQFALERSGGNPRPLVYNDGPVPGGGTVSDGAIESGPEPFESGDVHGEIYRYVVYPGAPPDCAGCTEADLKRMVVAIKLDSTASGGERTYQELQSDVMNPDATPTTNPVDPTPETQNEISTMWLTDTPCNQTERQPLTGDHATHNTRGVCANGVQSGNTLGAPDLMFTQRPLETPFGQTGPYDYATDVEPQQGQNQDIGLALRRTTSSDGCLLQQVTSLTSLDRLIDLPSAEGNRQQAMHLWLSNPLNNNFRLLQSADATLELWTKSVNGASYPGRICVSVFKRVRLLREVRVLGVVISTQSLYVDVPATINLTNLIYRTYEQNPWPQQWTKISIPMHLTIQNLTDVVSGLTGVLNQLLGGLGTLSVVDQPRLGLAITTERSGTGNNGLEFMYDDPPFESRLEINTSPGLCLLCP